MLRLDFRTTDVHAEYWIPASELAHARAADPQTSDFADYLLRHLAAESPRRRVAGRCGSTACARPSYVDHPYFVADVEAGAAARVPAHERS